MLRLNHKTIEFWTVQFVKASLDQCPDETSRPGMVLVLARLQDGTGRNKLQTLGTRSAQIMNITFLIRDINHPVEDQNLDFLVSKIEFLHFLSSAFRSFRPFGDQSSHNLNFWSKLFFLQSKSNYLTDEKQRIARINVGYWDFLWNQ